MAVLDNGLETIELGATAWRIILNNNIEKLYTKDECDDKFAQKNGDENEQFKVKDADDDNEAVSYNQLKNPANDMVFTDDNIGPVLIDRSNNDDYYRLYVDDGELKIEKV